MKKILTHLLETQNVDTRSVRYFRLDAYIKILLLTALYLLTHSLPIVALGLILSMDLTTYHKAFFPTRPFKVGRLTNRQRTTDLDTKYIESGLCLICEFYLSYSIFHRFWDDLRLYISGINTRFNLSTMILLRCYLVAIFRAVIQIVKISFMQRFA